MSRILVWINERIITVHGDSPMFYIFPLVGYCDRHGDWGRCLWFGWLGYMVALRLDLLGFGGRLR